MNLNDCYNFNDFRKLAKKKLPSPIFHYIDGAADDEITYARNTSAFSNPLMFTLEFLFLSSGILAVIILILNKFYLKKSLI